MHNFLGFKTTIWIMMTHVLLIFLLLFIPTYGKEISHGLALGGSVWFFVQTIHFYHEARNKYYGMMVGRNAWRNSYINDLSKRVQLALDILGGVPNYVIGVAEEEDTYDKVGEVTLSLKVGDDETWVNVDISKPLADALMEARDEYFNQTGRSPYE
jgi:hypothetical protein